MLFLKKQAYFLSNTRPIIVYFSNTEELTKKKNNPFFFWKGQGEAMEEVSGRLKHLHQVTWSIELITCYIFVMKNSSTKIFTGLLQVTVMFS